MKRRVRKIANFFAFNLLFFALYLNFIHKDKIALPEAASTQQNAAAFSGTVLVENPADLSAKATIVKVADQSNEKATESNATALKLSIN